MGRHFSSPVQFCKPVTIWYISILDLTRPDTLIQDSPDQKADEICSELLQGRADRNWRDAQKTKCMSKIN